MSLKNGVITTLIVVLLLVASHFISGLLGIHTASIGNLFLLYWAGIMKLKNYKNAVCGGLVGITIPLIGTLLAANLGPKGLILFLVLVAVCVLLYVMGKLQIIINSMTMLYIVVYAILIPPVDQSVYIERYKGYVLSLAIFSIAYFIYGKIMSKKQCKDS